MDNKIVYPTVSELVDMKKSGELQDGLVYACVHKDNPAKPSIWIHKNELDAWVKVHEEAEARFARMLFGIPM